MGVLCVCELPVRAIAGEIEISIGIVGSKSAPSSNVAITSSMSSAFQRTRLCLALDQSFSQHLFLIYGMLNISKIIRQLYTTSGA